MGGAVSKFEKTDWEKANGKLQSNEFTVDGAPPTTKYATYHLTKRGMNQREFDVTDDDGNLLYTTKQVPGTIACFDVLGRGIDDYLLRINVDIARRYWTVYRYGEPSFVGQRPEKISTEKLAAERLAEFQEDPTCESFQTPYLFRRVLITVSWSRYMAVTSFYGPPAPSPRSSGLVPKREGSNSDFSNAKSESDATSEDGSTQKARSWTWSLSTTRSKKGDNADAEEDTLFGKVSNRMRLRSASSVEHEFPQASSIEVALDEEKGSASAGETISSSVCEPLEDAAFTKEVLNSSPPNDDYTANEKTDGVKTREAGNEGSGLAETFDSVEAGQIDHSVSEEDDAVAAMHESSSMFNMNGSPFPPDDPEELATASSIHSSLPSIPPPDVPQREFSGDTATGEDTKQSRRSLRGWIQKKSSNIREKSQAYLGTSRHKKKEVKSDPLEGEVDLDGPLLLMQEIYNKIVGNHQTSLVSKQQVLELLKQDEAQHKKDQDEGIDIPEEEEENPIHAFQEKLHIADDTQEEALQSSAATESEAHGAKEAKTIELEENNLGGNNGEQMTADGTSIDIAEEKSAETSIEVEPKADEEGGSAASDAPSPKASDEESEVKIKTSAVEESLEKGTTGKTMPSENKTSDEGNTSESKCADGEHGEHASQVEDQVQDELDRPPWESDANASFDSKDADDEEEPLVGYWLWENNYSFTKTHKMTMHLAKDSDLALHVVLAIVCNQVRYERNALAMTI